MVALQDVAFEWHPALSVDDRVLEECAALFSAHYGVWGAGAARPGRRIALTANRLRKDLCREDTWLALARHQGELVGHAFALRKVVPDRGTLSWITQLVVHKDFENIGIAKNLLASIWGFSDDYAWGLLTANPKAVRALEKATRRRCDPRVIARHIDKIVQVGTSSVLYAAERPIDCTPSRAAIDTAFHVDHGTMADLIEKCSAGGRPQWALGMLKEGEEWLAFTVREQEEFALTPVELDVLLQHSEDKLRDAFGRMTLDQNHKWALKAGPEVDFLIHQLGLSPGDRVLDLGCGQGRHALELARRGIKVVGVDFVRAFVDRARAQADADGLKDCAFVFADCRTVSLDDKPFDAAIALYDVIGSHPDDRDNAAILETMRRHVRPGGKIVLSVMNMELTLHRAKYRASVAKNPEALLKLAPSRTMEKSGDIFDPEFYLVDPETHLVYRKEQFSKGVQLPSEIIVRDRRYTKNGICELVDATGYEVVLSRYVKTGDFERDLDATSGKEILVVAARRR